MHLSIEFGLEIILRKTLAFVFLRPISVLDVVESVLECVNEMSLVILRKSRLCLFFRCIEFVTDDFADPISSIFNNAIELVCVERLFFS